MSCNDTQSLDHGQDDEQSWRWSTATVSSTSPETCLDDKSTDSSIPTMTHEITEKTLSHIPKGYNMLERRIESAIEADFHERQVNCAHEGAHLTTKHVSAITLSLQQCSDIINRDPPQVDPQAEMLVGLQMHMKPNPPPAFPVDLCADLDKNHRPYSPGFIPIAVDEHYSEADVADPLESAYATAYQLRAPGVLNLDYGVAHVMRREAAFDDAIFRPRFPFPRPPACELRRTREWTGDSMGGAVIQRHIRKRRREEKETD